MSPIVRNGPSVVFVVLDFGTGTHRSGALGGPYLLCKTWDGVVSVLVWVLQSCVDFDGATTCFSCGLVGMRAVDSQIVVEGVFEPGCWLVCRASHVIDDVVNF